MKKSINFPSPPLQCCVRACKKLMPSIAAYFFSQTETHCTRSLGTLCYPTLKRGMGVGGPTTFVNDCSPLSVDCSMGTRASVRVKLKTQCKYNSYNARTVRKLLEGFYQDGHFLASSEWRLWSNSRGYSRCLACYRS